ncbi:Tm-1-like ATP-binding domain-containing protein [Streptomyces sp. ISL-36]|uniref:Tm-1-like ATP-binding domain-containing protein n=1 Tax=Streptomyces sp. ISL-36 TaxID=2819182 RepID=UPI001BE908AE|nr:Tm-1-like ATP-binding domain-containing protein [Streptomyces sp. ISL-36]MBT2439551.1 Tm-1-like ATP-binding domain-containing protein [Streptomyces sp. ISL-36]
MTIVVLVGTLDTKGLEYGWLRERLLLRGVEVVVVDTGVIGSPRIPADVSRAEVARAAGVDLERLRAEGDRGAAVTTMARGAAEVVRRLYAEGRLHGVLALGGSGGTSIATRAMRELPLGVPKVMVSSMAAGDVSPYVGSADITMMYSVVDIAGVNRLSAPILANAVDAVAGMAKGFAAAPRAVRPAELGEGGSGGPDAGERPLIAASMAGVTTSGVDAARERMTEHGYEVLVFHASGTGGRTLESLADRRLFAGTLDLTLCELADELFGGILTAGPDRLLAAGRRGVPQVVSPGALDLVKFGPLDTVPARVRDRDVRVHNPSISVVRTTARECAELGALLAAKLRAATGPTAVCLPLRGLSTLGAPGGPYHDPAADEALFAALRDGLRGSAVDIVEIDTHLNDPSFGRAAADLLQRLIADASE